MMCEVSSLEIIGIDLIIVVCWRMGEVQGKVRLIAVSKRLSFACMEKNKIK